MAHKGYTLNYFIDFFQSIPDHQWCVGHNQRNRVQHCAQGHVWRDRRTTLDKTANHNVDRLEILNKFLGTSVVSINDGQVLSNGTNFNKLGKTPRGRVLRALRNHKRYGNVFGKNYRPKVVTPGTSE